MLGGRACEISIGLDPIPRPFYNAGDTVSGRVTLSVQAQSVSVKDIQVKLRCDEFSAIAFDDDQKQAMVEMREAKHERRLARRERNGRSRRGAKDLYTEPSPSAAKEHQRHIELVSNVFVADSTNGKHHFEKGVHTFDFNFVLPENIHMLPPHSPVPTRNGLTVGVQWSLKAVAHRAGRLKSSVRALAELPVHPTPKNAEKADLTRRAELSGLKKIGKPKKWSFIGMVSGSSDAAHSEQQLVIRFGYPEAGIPQGPLTPNFSLTLEASDGVVTVNAINVYLVQRCLASVHKKLTMKDAYKNMFPLGQIKTLLEVSSTQDVSNLVSGFALRDVFASPFSSNFITVSYELRLELECVQSGKDQPQFVVLEVPINLLGPGMCWPRELSGNYEGEAKPVVPVLKENVDSDTSSTTGTAPTDANNTLPSYEEALPMSNTRVIDEGTFNTLKN